MSKTQKLHIENLTMFNNNYLLFDKRATNSLKKRLDLPLNFNRSKKINLQLTFLLVLLFEGKIKPTLKDAEERAKQPEPEPEPEEPAAPIHPPLNPLTYEQYREYNNFYNNVLNNTDPEYFKDNKFFILDDTTNNKGFIKGGYSILNKLLKGNTYLYNNIVLIVYGFKRQVIYNKDIIDYDEETGQFQQVGTVEAYRKDHYLTDYTYNFIYNKHILNHQILQNSKDGYKGTLYKIFSEITNSGEQYATMQIILEPLTTPEQHQHQFKYGKINCFLNSIKSQLLEGGQRSKCDEMKKMYIDKIDILNDTYFNCGVGLTDIKKIEKNLKININVVNAIGDYIYKNDDNNDKRQIITLKTPYNDHIADYVQNEQNEMANKNKIVVDDIEQHYLNNLSSFKYFKKNSEHKKVYYYDEHNIYYEAFKINNEVVNEDEIYIFDLLSYYKQKFINDNNLLNNVITNKDNLFYDFINSSVHHIDKYINTDLLKSMFGNQKILKIDNSTDLNILDVEQNEFYKSVNISFNSIDNNKCFIGFLNESTPAGEIYKKLGVPQSKFNFYKITEQPTPEYKDIILYGPHISFIEVDNICFINDTIKNMKLIKNGYIYTSYFLKYCIDNNIINNTFEWRTIATAQSMQYLKFCSEIIEQKFYNEIIGCMSSNMEHTILNFEVKNNADIKDILYYNSLNKDENNKILTYNKTVSIYTKKNIKQNRSHIASCILSYALINIIDVVKDVNINNLLYVKCDGISTLKPLNIELTPNIGGWKNEDKKFISVNYNTSFINYKESLIYNDNNIYPLTTHKQLYKSVNFITGAAGCAKTSRFLKKFDNTDDERIFNSLLLVPSNCLLYGLKKNNEALNIATYQSFIMAFYQMEDTHRENKKKFVKYTNIILDESTMINNNEMTKILKICKDNNFNVFIVGDYDIINKKSYQLKPPTNDEFFKCDDINDDLIKNSYQLHLTKNYRQNGDKHLYNLLNECRDKTNEYIKNLLLNHKMIKKIDYNDVIINYKNNEQILSSVNKFIDKINNDINDTKAENDDIKIMYCNTSKDTAKNESAIIKKKDFNKKSHFLGYSITSHKAQGLTYTDNIYINLKNLFTDNILYVMISRAQRIEQIYIITE